MTAAAASFSSAIFPATSATPPGPGVRVGLTNTTNGHVAGTLEEACEPFWAPFRKPGAVAAVVFVRGLGPPLLLVLLKGC